MLNRRAALMLLSGSVVVPKMGFAATPREITWDDLLPPGLPYAEIIGEGELDEANDLWNPIYDENATKLNEELNGAYIKMPGFIIPFETGVEGVTDFMLVPYVGACLHTPPPPANQLVMVTAAEPWPSEQLWDPVWVTGRMSTQLQSTSLGQTGYSIAAADMDVYEW
ncbi:DUF3299 domain-containing protein [Pseudoruegeria sp. SK021]|uniref:DUF3299 domain-containing protein n=1 Tax=Pseudoruegeria sp. SK021 TaxID=1933035 RepID=UPI000A2456C8|nr:DUF3299 domain-containing protein [Pseudoruegeria sp. SK021]OSP55798.1 hypothetical protein BV911_05295 [Pseudoruegeria sp. SK021]